MVESIGPGCAHKYPDYLIVNTGAHDKEKSLDVFATKMQRLASWLGEAQLKLGSRVIWRGNNAIASSLGSLHAYETIARYYIEKEGLRFLDVGPFFTAFEADLQTDCCRDKGLHVGVIGKYYSNGNRNGTYIYVSSMITQGLLDYMFRDPHKASCLRGL